MPSLLKHIKSSLRLKLILIIEALVLVIGLALGITVTICHRNDLEDELHGRGIGIARNLAQFSAAPLISEDLPTLMRYIAETMKQDCMSYVMILNPDGRVVMHSNLNECGNVYDDVRTRTALTAAGPGFSHFVAENGERIDDIYVPVIVSGARLGTIRMGYSHAGIESKIQRAVWRTGYITLAVMMIGGCIGYMIALVISSPIRQIRHALESVAGGNLDVTVPVFGKDELGGLAESFNRMTRDLQETTYSKTYFVSILQSMTESVIIVDSHLKIGMVNHRGLRLLGYDEHELAGKDISAVIAPKTGGTDTRYMESMLGRGNFSDIEMVMMRKDGEKIPVLMSAGELRTSGGNFAGWVCMAIDITRIKKARATIRTLSSAVTQSINGTAIADLGLGLTYVNDMFARFHGYFPEEMIGMNLDRLVHDSGGANELAAIINHIQFNRAWIGEARHIKKDGTVFPVSLSMTLMVDDDDVPSAILVSMMDISEKKRLESEIRHAQRMESITTFARGIAHHFNNLLMSIQGNAELLTMQKPVDRRFLDKMLSNIGTQVEKGAGLTRKLMNYANRETCSFRKVNLNQLVRQTAETFNMVQRDIRIHLELAEDLYPIRADENGLDQVMLNFYQNAADAMSGTGDIYLVTSNMDGIGQPEENRPYHLMPGRYAILSIRDTGKGIDRGVAEHIFDPFFSTKDLSQATGLGLSSNYDIITAHGGHVSVSSEAGKGATFTVWLPAMDPDTDDGAPFRAIDTDVV